MQNNGYGCFITTWLLFTICMGGCSGCVYLNYDSNGENFLYGGIFGIILGVISIPFAKKHWDKEDEKERMLYDALEKVRQIALQYQTQLASERERLITHDIYGNEDYSKWINKGVIYFMQTTVYPVLSHQEQVLISNLVNKVGFDFYNNPQSYFYIIDKVAKEKQYFLQQEVNFSDSLTGIQYEKLCGRLLLKAGWKIQYTKESGDQGVDILAQKDTILVAIQCKKYKRPVGNKAVQEVVAGKQFYQATHAVVIAANGFTNAAQELAQKTNVILLSHNLIENLDEYLNKINYF